MGTRFYNVVVVGFWLATMSWLLVDKLWPTLRVGDPPNFHSILKAQEGEAANHWAIYWNDKLTGWSVGDVSQQPGGIRELHSRVFIADLPLDELVPRWLGTVIKPVLNQAGRWDMEMRSRLDVDRVGQIAGFDSTLQIAGGSPPLRVYGTVEGDKLTLHSTSGELPGNFSLARNALVGDGISPQGYLPDLYLDQAWTVFAYNPFQPASEPLEILEARVEQHEFDRLERQTDPGLAGRLSGRIGRRADERMRGRKSGFATTTASCCSKNWSYSVRGSASTGCPPRTAANSARPWPPTPTRKSRPMPTGACWA